MKNFLRMQNYIQGNRKAAIVALLLAALLWSSAGIAFRLLDTVTNGLAISGYRSFFALIFYVCAFKSLPKFEGSKWFVLGIIGHTMATSLFAVSNTLTTAANAIVLQYTAPIFACFYLLFLLKKPLPKHDILAVGIIVIGICIFFVDSLTLQLSPAMTLGNSIAIASGAGIGLQAVVIAQVKNPRNVLIFANLINIAIALPFMLLNPIGSLFDLGILIYLGVIQIGLSYLLYTFAVAKVTPLELILIPALEPVLNPVWVFLFDGQAPSLVSVAGGIIIIMTILLWSLYKEKYVPQGHPG